MGLNALPPVAWPVLPRGEPVDYQSAPPSTKLHDLEALPIRMSANTQPKTPSLPHSERQPHPNLRLSEAVIKSAQAREARYMEPGSREQYVRIWEQWTWFCVSNHMPLTPTVLMYFLEWRLQNKMPLTPHSTPLDGPTAHNYGRVIRAEATHRGLLWTLPDMMPLVHYMDSLQKDTGLVSANPRSPILPMRTLWRNWQRMEAGSDKYAAYVALMSASRAADLVVLRPSDIDVSDPKEVIIAWAPWVDSRGERRRLKTRRSEFHRTALVDTQQDRLQEFVNFVKLRQDQEYLFRFPEQADTVAKQRAEMRGILGRMTGTGHSRSVKRSCEDALARGHVFSDRDLASYFLKHAVEKGSQVSKKYESPRAQALAYRTHDAASFLSQREMELINDTSSSSDDDREHGAPAIGGPVPLAILERDRRDEPMNNAQGVDPEELTIAQRVALRYNRESLVQTTTMVARAAHEAITQAGRALSQPASPRVKQKKR